MKTLLALMAVAVLITYGARDACSQSQPCIIALDATAAGSLTATGNTTVTANCGVAVNSTSPDAVDLKGIASVAVESISVVGGFSLSGRAQLTPAPQTGQLPVPDPLSFLASQFPANTGTCDFVNLVITDTPSTPLTRGVYCNGIQVEGDAVVTLNPGLYILQGGGLTVEGNSTLTGSGVIFYNTGSVESFEPIVIGHSASVQLSAATSGTFANVLFYADPNIVPSQTSIGQTTNVFGAGAGSTFAGALYFPHQIVSLDNFSAGGCSGLVADQIEFAGDVQLPSKCSGF